MVGVGIAMVAMSSLVSLPNLGKLGFLPTAPGLSIWRREEGRVSSRLAVMRLPPPLPSSSSSTTSSPDLSTANEGFSSTCTFPGTDRPPPPILLGALSTLFVAWSNFARSSALPGFGDKQSCSPGGATSDSEDDARPLLPPAGELNAL